MIPLLLQESCLSKFFLFCLAGYPHNPYNGVICNDTITATGVFSSKQLWRLAKGIEQNLLSLLEIVL